MANTIFETTYSASQQITATFDMVWALDAGLWNLRQAANQYFLEHPQASSQEAKNSLVKGLYIHGLNPNSAFFEASHHNLCPTSCILFLSVFSNNLP